MSNKIRTFGPVVATEPFVDVSVRLKTSGEGAVKAVRIENMSSTVWLKVFLANDSQRILPGMRVLVGGKAYLQNWAKSVQELDGSKFILVPEKEILAVDYGA